MAVSARLNPQLLYTNPHHRKLQPHCKTEVCLMDLKCYSTNSCRMALLVQDNLYQQQTSAMSGVSYACTNDFPALYINLVILSMYVVLNQCSFRRFGAFIAINATSLRSFVLF